MTAVGVVLAALATTLVCLNIHAVRRVYRSSYYSREQRLAQTALILCIPVIGAYLVLYMARDDVPMFQSPPVEHDWDIDASCDDVGHHQ